MSYSLPRKTLEAIQNANEGDEVTVHIQNTHPIAKIRFGPEYTASGEFVRFKHGVLKLLDQKKNYVMIPAMIIGEVKITRCAIATTTP